jgi:hypothetical protein
MTLREAALALVDYLDEEEIYDRGDDDGDGYVDGFRSKRFSALIGAVRHAAKEVSGEALSAGSDPAGALRPE